VKSLGDNLGLLNLLWSLKVWYSFWEKVSWVDLGNILHKQTHTTNWASIEIIETNIQYLGYQYKVYHASSKSEIMPPGFWKWMQDNSKVKEISNDNKFINDSTKQNHITSLSKGKMEKLWIILKPIYLFDIQPPILNRAWELNYDHN